MPEWLPRSARTRRARKRTDLVEGDYEYSICRQDWSPVFAGGSINSSVFVHLQVPLCRGRHGGAVAAGPPAGMTPKLGKARTDKRYGHCNLLSKRYVRGVVGEEKGRRLFTPAPHCGLESFSIQC